MQEISNRLITAPKDWGGHAIDTDGLPYEQKGLHVHDCIIDLSNFDPEGVDEACGLTQGAYGKFERCLIRGADKLILMGCGDKEWVAREKGKTFDISYCVLEDFGRRGPEVQDGMIANLDHCLIRNWGSPDNFDTRAFGSWAHKGGIINAYHCIFHQSTFFPNFKCWFLDHWHHFWQCMHERGLAGLTHRDAWLSGYKRGLTAGPDGEVHAYYCMATDKRIVIESHSPSVTMPANEGMLLKRELDEMVDRLVTSLMGTGSGK